MAHQVRKEMKTQRYHKFLPFMIAQTFGSGSTYFLHVFLGRFLGIVGYGTIAIFWSALNVVAATQSYGIPQFVSRAVADESEEVGFLNAFLIQTALATASFMLLLGPWFLTFELSVLLLGLFLGALFIVGYGANTILLGVLNGQRRYLHQASIYALVSVTRLIVSVAMVTTGFNYVGVMIGLSVAPFLPLAIGRYFVGKQLRWTGKKTASIRNHLEYALPIALYGIGFSFLMNSPIIALSIALQDIRIMGLVQSALTLAMIGYAMLSTVSIIVFPAIISSRAIGGDEGIKTFRASIEVILALSAMAIPFVICFPTEIIVLVFSTTYAEAGVFLLPLVLSMIALSLLTTASTALFAQNRSHLAATVTCITSAMALFGESIAGKLIGVQVALWIFSFLTIFGAIAAFLLVVKSFRQHPVGALHDNNSA